MIRVEDAEKIIMTTLKDFGTETVSFNDCLGRVLAADICADRDMPPFNRVTMDGIAIRYSAYRTGKRVFHIKATQSAGEAPIDIANDDECIEIMTGAVLPTTTDTVIPYEEVEILNKAAKVVAANVIFGQSIHLKGKDKKKNEVLVKANQFITPTIISIAATVGKAILLVKKLPRTIIISTGDELTGIDEIPSDSQIRRSNNYTIDAILKEHGLHADLLHLPDNMEIIGKTLMSCIHEYDVILLSGGVSMGKFDYVPVALEKLQVAKLFHKVQQRPGKPFWFGSHGNGTVVFAFPGNPVSTFMCVYRYFLPWLKGSLQIKTRKSYAILNENFTFQPALQYFLQVRLNIDEKGNFLATPAEGNGSGDFANLLETDAFMELPLERNDFKKGEVFPIWAFKQIM